MAQKSTLKGEAAKLAREFTKGGDIQTLVAAANTQLSRTGRLVLFESISEQQKVERGLLMNPHTGKLAVAQAVAAPQLAMAEHHEPSSTQQPMTLAEIAGTMNKSRRAQPPTIHQGSTLYIANYGIANAVSPHMAEHALDEGTTYRARLDVLRRGPSIAEAEVSYLAHDGGYDDDGNGFGSVRSHGINILTELTKSPEPIKWRTRQQTGNVTYGTSLAQLDDGRHVPIIVRSELVGEAVEAGAKLSYEGVGRYATSRGRLFGLRADTFFAADFEADETLLEVFVNGELEHDKIFGLTGNAASSVAERVGNPSLLAPSYTTFTMTQEVLGRPQTATLQDFPDF